MATGKKGSDAFRDPAIEEILRSHLTGGDDDFTYVEQFPLDQVKRAQESQSRLGVLDRSYVNQIAEKMKAKVQFGPIVIWQDGDTTLMCDGNHRGAAAIKRGLTHYPAYLVSLTGTDEAIYLSAVFNGQHGKRLDSEELRRAVLAASSINPQPNNARLAADYGVSATQIGKIRTEHAITQRLESLSVPEVEKLNQGHLMQLAKLPLDAPLRNAAELILQSEMTAGDAKELVDDLLKTGSEGGQIDRLQIERDQRDEDIKAVKAGRRSSGSPIKDMRRVVGQLERLIDTFPKPETWLTRDPQAVTSWAPRVQRVSEFFSNVSSNYVESFEAVQAEESDETEDDAS